MGETVPPLPLRLDSVARDNLTTIYYLCTQTHIYVVTLYYKRSYMFRRLSFDTVC
jgi:hypothetical protein